MLTKEQGDRLAWLEHCLSDPDAGRLMSRLQLTAMDEEREHLRELKAAPAEAVVAHDETCSMCGGVGKIRSGPSGTASPPPWVECPNCRGTGKVLVKG